MSPLKKVMDENNALLSRFGFTFYLKSVHLSRTFMLSELTALLAYVNRPEAEKNDYLRAIQDDNCLGKRSVKNRILTCGHMVNLYSFDRKEALFRSLLYFWNRDIIGRPLLALICSCARDPILHSTAPFILNFQTKSLVLRESVEEFLEGLVPGRFSKVSINSMASNINATLTKSGHLLGKFKKVRSQAIPTPGSVSYALFLGYLTGARGLGLFKTDYVRLLDCSCEHAITLAKEASAKGWIVFKNVGEVVEVVFPKLLTQEEKEWLSEQN
jgi:uncharacterized protein YqgQ